MEIRSVEVDITASCMGPPLPVAVLCRRIDQARTSIILAENSNTTFPAGQVQRDAIQRRQHKILRYSEIPFHLLWFFLIYRKYFIYKIIIIPFYFRLLVFLLDKNATAYTGQVYQISGVITIICSPWSAPTPSNANSGPRCSGKVSVPADP